MKMHVTEYTTPAQAYAVAKESPTFGKTVHIYCDTDAEMLALYVTAYADPSMRSLSRDGNTLTITGVLPMPLGVMQDYTIQVSMYA